MGRGAVPVAGLSSVEFHLLSQLREAVAIISPDIKVMWVNDQFCRVTGYRADEMVGQPLTLFRSGVHSEADYREMLYSVRKEGHWRGEIWRRRKDGEVYAAWLTISAIYDEAGEIECIVEIFVDVGKMRQERERLAFLVNHDPLTRLPNRRLVEDRLASAIRHASREGSYLAVVFVDLDNYKAVNDTYGHSFGDKVLVKVACALSKCLRESDTVARVGGDEFLVLLESGQSREEALEAMERIQSTLDTVMARFDLGIPLGVSLGLAIYPDDGDTPETLYAAADRAMYEQKAASHR